jgi:hypothetical protein
MVTIDELRALQRENAEADEKFWTGLQGMNTELAEGHKEVAAKSARLAADAEAGATAAAEKASVAKDRIERLFLLFLLWVCGQRVCVVQAKRHIHSVRRHPYGTASHRLHERGTELPRARRKS